MSPLERKTLWLKRFALFSSLSDQEIEVLAGRVRERRLARRETVFDVGSDGEEVYLLRGGRVRLLRISERGKEIVYAIYGPGDIFGEECLFSPTGRPAMAQALEESFLLVMSARDLRVILEKRPQVSAQFITSLGRRSLSREAQIEDLAFRSVPQRVASVLLRLSQDHGIRNNGTVTIEVRLTHRELASMVAATRESVTNVIGDLEKRGLISVEKKRVKILNRQLLLVEAAVRSPAMALPTAKTHPAVQPVPQ